MDRLHIAFGSIVEGPTEIREKEFRIIQQLSSPELKRVCIMLVSEHLSEQHYGISMGFREDPQRYSKDIPKEDS